MKKKKILLITAISPFPQDNGGATRIKNTIKELSQSFDLYLVSFKNSDYEFTTLEKSELKKWCVQATFVPVGNHKTVGSYFDLGQPYWFSDWYSPELITIVNSILEGQNIDLIQVEFSQLLYLIDYLDQKDRKKCIFTAHDISTISFFRRLGEVKDLKQKIIHFFRFLEIYFYEKKYLPKYRLVNAVSQNDNILLKKYFKPQKVLTVANGIEKVEFLKPNKLNKIIILGYIGSFSHPPNRTAFLYFINQIAPELEKCHISYKYLLAGKNDDQEIKLILSKISSNIKNKIIILGFIDDPQNFYQKIDILITPIFAGSGSRIKILEALGYGKKIISSPVGAEGINLKTDLISIAHTPQEYVREIKNFQHHKKNLNYDSEKPKISELTWENIFNNYEKIIT